MNGKYLGDYQLQISSFTDVIHKSGFWGHGHAIRIRIGVHRIQQQNREDPSRSTTH